MSFIHQTPLFPGGHSPMNWKAVITGAERDKGVVTQERGPAKHSHTNTHTTAHKTRRIKHCLVAEIHMYDEFIFGAQIAVKLSESVYS